MYVSKTFLKTICMHCLYFSLRKLEYGTLTSKIFDMTFFYEFDSPKIKLIISTRMEIFNFDVRIIKSNFRSSNKKLEKDI